MDSHNSWFPLHRLKNLNPTQFTEWKNKPVVFIVLNFQNYRKFAHSLQPDFNPTFEWCWDQSVLIRIKPNRECSPQITVRINPGNSAFPPTVSIYHVVRFRPCAFDVGLLCCIHLRRSRSKFCIIIFHQETWKMAYSTWVAYFWV